MNVKESYSQIQDEDRKEDRERERSRRRRNFRLSKWANRTNREWLVIKIKVLPNRKLPFVSKIGTKNPRDQQ